VLDRIDEAMVRLELDPRRVVIVTDIGCVGLSDQWFTTHAFHGLHGRSVVYGEGLKLASPDLHVVVLTGDGGAGIGLHHLINAAKRNMGVTVVLFNNMNFGMTGGEPSITTPEGAVTSTTAAGHLERPVKLCETLQTNFAPFVARRAYYDKDLTDVIERAIAFEGFSFVEVMEFCPAYYVPLNKFSKKDMEQILQPDYLPRMTAVDPSGTEYTTSYRRHCQQLEGNERSEGIRLERRFRHQLSGSMDVVIAGSAGMRIGTTATLFARAAVMSGLQAVQRDDYPVTVRTGHSLSFVKLSEQRIGYMGINRPDVLFVLSEDGLKKTKSYLSAMQNGQKVYLLSTLPGVETRADVTRVTLDKLPRRVPTDGIALSILSAYLETGGPFPVQALTDCIRMNPDQKLATKQLRFAGGASPTIFGPVGSDLSVEVP
jgi:pyruvate/2-oxoacid:ferredoxin oxidoreductase beta subunit